MKKYVFAIAMVALVLQSFNSISKDKATYTAKKETKKEVHVVADKGADVYSKVCIACHQANGQGIPGAFPPLAKSDFLNKDVNRAIGIVKKGHTGAITVNGAKFNGSMPNPNLTEQQVADVLTYVYGQWGNSKKVVTLAMVKAHK